MLQQGQGQLHKDLGRQQHQAQEHQQHQQQCKQQGGLHRTSQGKQQQQSQALEPLNLQRSTEVYNNNSGRLPLLNQQRVHPSQLHPQHLISLCVGCLLVGHSRLETRHLLSSVGCLLLVAHLWACLAW
jgi:hypothetical protein